MKINTGLEDEKLTILDDVPYGILFWTSENGYCLKVGPSNPVNNYDCINISDGALRIISQFKKVKTYPKATVELNDK